MLKRFLSLIIILILLTSFLAFGLKRQIINSSNSTIAVLTTDDQKAESAKSTENFDTNLAPTESDLSKSR